MTTLTEADVRAAAINWLAALSGQMAHGPDIVPMRRGA